jgi:hypothetical protein
VYINVHKANQKSCKQIILIEFPTPSSCKRIKLKYYEKTGWYGWSCDGASGYAATKKEARKAARKKCGKQSPIQTGTKEEAIGSIKSSTGK